MSWWGDAGGRNSSRAAPQSALAACTWPRTAALLRPAAQKHVHGVLVCQVHHVHLLQHVHIHLHGGDAAQGGCGERGQQKGECKAKCQAKGTRSLWGEVCLSHRRRAGPQSGRAALQWETEFHLLVRGPRENPFSLKYPSGKPCCFAAPPAPVPSCCLEEPVSSSNYAGSQTGYRAPKFSAFGEVV